MNSMGPLGAVSALILIAGACDDFIGPFEIPNQDAPSVRALERNPTRSVVLAAAQGLLEGVRNGTESQISELAHYGREGYYLAVARTILDEFDEPLVPDGGIGWSTAYTFIRTANSLRRAVDVVTELTEEEKEAIRGFAKTVEAYLLHGQIRVHDEFGIVVDTDRDRGELAPIVSKAEAFAFIAQRLEEARTHLGNAGNEFPFALSPGFDGFDTPASFSQFTWALEARVLAEIGDYDGVLAALEASFLNPVGDLTLGAYNSYSTASGDELNGFYDPSGFQYLADTLLVVDAQLKANGERDNRITRKTAEVPYITHTGVTSNLRWTIYESPTAPIPIIKNEELILLRAEARMFTGDRSGAMSDINVIRTRSGGLAPLASDPGDPGLLSELLYNRRYSLLFEYGHRWVDLRRFDRLTDLRGPRGPGDRVFDKVPLPAAECDQRGNEPAGCTQVDGFRTTA